jgi:hypothetical protein
MSMPKPFQTVFGEAFSRGLKGAIEGAAAPAERDEGREVRLKQQRSLLHFIQIKHANILRALADR